MHCLRLFALTHITLFMPMIALGFHRQSRDFSGHMVHLQLCSNFPLHFVAPRSASGLLQTSSHAGLGITWKSTYIGGVLLGVAFCFQDLALLRKRVFACLPHEMLIC